MLVDFACGRAMRELAVRDDVFDVLGADHHTLAKVEAPGGVQQFAFAPDVRDGRFAIGPDGQRVAPSLGSFVLLGVEHILTGYDHLLFLLALLLGGGSWLALAKIITAFTVAHSATLALAVFGIAIVPAPGGAVIALSVPSSRRRTSSCARPRRALAGQLLLRPRPAGLVGPPRWAARPWHRRGPVRVQRGVELGQGLMSPWPARAALVRRGLGAADDLEPSLAIPARQVALFVERAFF
jgi:hypothetical protein